MLSLLTNLANKYLIIGLCLLLLILPQTRLHYGVPLSAGALATTILNHTIKILVCRERPDVMLHLVDESGFSFPSGHTQVASSFFGSCSLSMWNKNKAVSFLCAVVIFLTALSRNFLGVHTLTDVLASIMISVIMIAVNARLFEKVKKDRSLLYKLIAAGCAAAVLAIIYFTFKTYPVDYIDGDLVVDPPAMKNDGYAAAGAFFGVLAGAYIEIRYVHFTAEGTLPQKILRALCGVPFALVWMLVLKKPIYSLAGTAAGHVILYTGLTLYIVAGYPALFTAVRRRMNNRQAAEKG